MGYTQRTAGGIGWVGDDAGRKHTSRQVVASTRHGEVELERYGCIPLRGPASARAVSSALWSGEVDGQQAARRETVEVKRDEAAIHARQGRDFVTGDWATSRTHGIEDATTRRLGQDLCEIPARRPIGC